MKERNVAIVHFNTPELTEACIWSIRKHGGENYKVTVFDNSDKRPFTAKMDGVKVIDNTKGQIIDFAAELAKYPDREPASASVNDWGSDKHMMSIQALWDIIPDGFLLMDSDILLKSSVEHMFREEYCAVGHVQEPQPGNHFGVGRLVPMLCYINVPLCKKAGLQYFDPERAWMLKPGMGRRSNWYDTGASFLEDLRAHKNGARGLRIDIRPLMVHYKCGSWQRNDRKAQDSWLAQYRGLWQPTPRMRGVKSVAMCVIGRNENPYAVEWVEHYRKLGVIKIFVYDNWFDGEGRLADVLQDYVKTGFIEITDLHNRPNLQCRAYEHCYRLHGNEYAWIGFLDFDEYLRWNPRKKIESMFARYDNGDVVLINWRLMTDNGHLHYSDAPLAERFKEPMPLDNHVKYDFPENNHVKSFVRGGLGEIRFTANPHAPVGLSAVNTRGESVKCQAFVPYDHSVMRIDHYWTKSADEWRHNKLVRGFCSGKSYIESIMKNQRDYFFAVNEYSKLKEDIINGNE